MIPGVVWWCGGVVWWFGGFLTYDNTTPTKVVLNCFGLLVGLWQYSTILGALDGPIEFRKAVTPVCASSQMLKKW
jgi:hypothetical protein